MAFPLIVITPLATPHKTIHHMLDLIKPRGEIEAFILGWPLYMDGTLSPMCQQVERFKTLLEKISGKPVHLIDERLTSKLAESTLRILGYKKEDKKKRVDTAAASLILDAYLAKISKTVL